MHSVLNAVIYKIGAFVFCVKSAWPVKIFLA